MLTSVQRHYFLAEGETYEPDDDIGITGFNYHNRIPYMGSHFHCPRWRL